MNLEPSSILIIGIGNPSRGDDALGPMLIERLEALALPGVELLTDFQLQVEFALDLQHRKHVIFADASLTAAAPFTFTPAVATEDTSYSSHALSPSAVLHAYQKLFGEPPPSYLLAIRGEAFELGEGLTETAQANLNAAVNWLVADLHVGSNRHGPAIVQIQPATRYPIKHPDAGDQRQNDGDGNANKG